MMIVQSAPVRCWTVFFYTDAEVTDRLKEAVRRVGENQVRRFGQPPEEALTALGFDTAQLGAETYLKPVPKEREREREKAEAD